MSKPLSYGGIKELFLEYKNDRNLTTGKIANRMGLDRTTIGNYFRHFFKDEYRILSELKSKFMKPKLSEERKLKISLALKGKPKPPRSLAHRINLGKSMSKTYVERF